MDLKKTGRLIIKKRKKLGLTQEQLSEKLFVTPQAVSLWEKGLRYPDPTATVMIYRVLGLNPVELLTGLEMYNDDAKKAVAAHMNRIDEKVFVAGTVVDEDGFEEYLDLSEGIIYLGDGKGNASGKKVRYADYFNVEKPTDRPAENKLPKSEYDPGKIYLYFGNSIVVIPVELLEAIGRPLYFGFRWNQETMNLIIVAEDEKTEDNFDIPEKVYNGKWKGIRVYGGQFGVMLLKLMGIRNRRELLEVTPIVSANQRGIGIWLDDVKRSGVELNGLEYLLPQWQYEELIAEDEEPIEED